MLFTRKSINDRDGGSDPYLPRHPGHGRSSRAGALGAMGGAPIAATGVVLLAAGLVAGCGQGKAATVAAAAVKPYQAAPPTWAACQTPPTPQPGGLQPARNLQCARLTVPLDYAKPRGETIQIALIRVKATDQAHRIGSLVFNFGGPGGSGVEQFAAGATALFKKLGTRYDLVTFDPRGVGRSSPVTCADDKQKDTWMAMDADPDNAREEAALLTAERTFGQGCQKRSGKLLPYVGTVNAVRDLDVLRAALGDRKLNYFGFSYGTWLGAGYAHQFPKKVGRAVLDGAVNPELDPERFILQQTAGFQRALVHFSRWADRQPGTKTKGLTKIAALLNRLDTKPIRTDSGRKLTQSLGQIGVLTALYSKDFWPVLLQGIERAAAGDGTILLEFADSYPQRGPDGHYANLLDAHTAIACADTTKRYTEQDVKKALPTFTTTSPIFGPALAWRLTGCTGWRFKGDDAAQKADAPGAPPIVVVGTTGDPATPYAWAPALAKELGIGVLLTLKGEGHTAYLTGDPCIGRAVNRYLLNGNVPANGTTCRTQ